MTVELTLAEAEILIAVLTFAEDTAQSYQPIYAALADLRPWRSALLRTYVLGRLNDAQAVTP